MALPFRARLRAALWPPGIWHALLAGLAARLAAHAFVPLPYLPDALAFRAYGVDLIEKFEMAGFDAMPLYPLWTYVTGGGTGTLLADIAMSLAAVYLLYRLSLRLFHDPAAAVLAAFGFALYPFAIFYAIAGLTETMFVALVLAALVALYARRYVLGSLCLVLTVLVRGTLDLLNPLLILCFALVVHGQGWRVALRGVAVYAALYLVLLGPWWVHNWHKYGTFVRLAPITGFLLYSGNNPANQTGGGVNERTRKDVDRSHPAFRETDTVVRDAMLRDAALDYIRSNPGRFAELALLKFKRFWQPWPHATELRTPFFVTVTVLSYGVVLLLALAALPRLAGQWRMLSPVWLFIGYLTAVHMVLIASVRYRYPVEPFLILFAGHTAAWLMRRTGLAGAPSPVDAAARS